MKNILVTGAHGFIGRNLCANFQLDQKLNILKYTRNSKINELEGLIKKSSIIVHLAGENRSNKESDFIENNFQISQKICDILIKNNIKIPLIFSSTVHISLEDTYGKTKYMAEKSFKKLFDKNGNNICVLRLPGVFGKWSKPNYNSVTATFCHNIANDITCKIIDPEKVINLFYIDDLISIINKLIKSQPSGFNIIKINNYYKVSIENLYKKIKNFNLSRSETIPVNISVGFNKKLYATFLSYLPKSKMQYGLFCNEDKRGKFFEIFKEKNGSQLSLFTANEGFTRGGHYHNTKVEKFLVVSGKAKFFFRDINTKKNTTFILDENDYKVVESIPGNWHEVENIGQKELKVLVWANEVYNYHMDDTHR